MAATRPEYDTNGIRSPKEISIYLEDAIWSVSAAHTLRLNTKCYPMANIVKRIWTERFQVALITLGFDQRMNVNW